MLGLVASTMITCAAFCAVPECKTGTLASYIELGADGCSIGSIVVFDFFLSVIPTGAKEIPAEMVTVKPSRADSRPQLEFRVDAKAEPGEFLDQAFSFTARGTIGRSFVDGVGARLTGATAQGSGAVTVVNSLCPGDEVFFGFCFVLENGSALPSATAFVAGGEASRSAAVRASPAEIMGVLIDIGVDGGPSGRASLESAVVLLGSEPLDEQPSLALAYGWTQPNVAVREPLARLGRGRRMAK
jgi:hypothetical protein